MILAACHSLVEVHQPPPPQANEDEDGNAKEGTNSTAPSPPTTQPVSAESNLAGDPIEISALKSVEWTWDASTSTASPGNLKLQQTALEALNVRIVQMQTKCGELSGASTPANPQVQAQLTAQQQTLSRLQKQRDSLERGISDSRARTQSATFSKVQVVTRHFFSSRLQRMSVVVKAKAQKAGKTGSGSSGSSEESWFALCKGSPEAVRKLLLEGSVPDGYDSCYRALARKGLRVLALAYKDCGRVAARASPSSASPADQPREWAESELRFAGFVAFECKTRADSPLVIRSLAESGHKVAMLTGDSPLTSIHVARVCGIVVSPRRVAALTLGDAEQSAGECSIFIFAPFFLLLPRFP
jgi:magnesium-transporting ATPase (P-type)